MKTLPNLLPLVLLVITLGCARKADESAVDSADTTSHAGSFNSYLPETYTQLENYLSSGTREEATVIREPLALLINPTLEQIDSLEKEYGEDFYTIADDNAYYMSSASDLLDSLRLEHEPATDRYYTFIAGNRHWTVDIRKPGAPEWNIILFNPDSVPVICVPIDLTGDKLKSYFASSKSKK